jgi:hypothetical protein
LDVINLDDGDKNVNPYNVEVKSCELNRNLASNLVEKVKNDICYADSLTNLNLHNCHNLYENVFDKFIHFRHLKKLILSFNNLKELPDVTHMVILNTNQLILLFC